VAISLKKGDMVAIRAGKDKGKKGRILRVEPKKSQIIIEGINLVKKHAKPTKDNPKGGIIQKEASIHSSNVMVICSGCAKPTRVGKAIAKDEKTRVCLHCGAELGKKK
jgi:large subunit ribosomal protein L24